MGALCGATYLSRLWCVWELCTAMAFVPREHVADCVHLMKVTTDPQEDLVSRLKTFQISDAHCYDPNEESRVRRVIQAIGAERFEQKIRDLGEIYNHQVDTYQAQRTISRVSSLRSGTSIKSAGTAGSSMSSLSIKNWKIQLSIKSSQFK